MLRWPWLEECTNFHFLGSNEYFLSESPFLFSIRRSGEGDTSAHSRLFTCLAVARQNLYFGISIFGTFCQVPALARRH